MNYRVYLNAFFFIQIIAIIKGLNIYIKLPRAWIYGESTVYLIINYIRNLLLNDERIIIYKLTRNCFDIKPKYKCYKSKIIKLHI